MSAQDMDPTGLHLIKINKSSSVQIMVPTSMEFMVLNVSFISPLNSLKRFPLLPPESTLLFCKPVSHLGSPPFPSTPYGGQRI